MHHTPADTIQWLRVPVFPRYINELGNIKAGHVLKFIDIAGWLAPMKHTGPGATVVTASLDRTNFINPVRRWEMMTLESKVTRVWQSSMEAQVTITSEDLRTGTNKLVAVSYLVLVAMDARRNKLLVPPLDYATNEDKKLASAADLRKQNRKAEITTAPFLLIDASNGDTPVVVESLMGQDDANGFNNVFGGAILEVIHDAGSLAAKTQFLGGTVVGVRQDRMNFIGPAFIGETIVAQAIVTKTWISSIEVQVEVFAQNPTNKQRRSIGNSYLVYVGVDPEGKPVQVPPWQPRTDLQQQRDKAADLRKQLAKEEASSECNVTI
jgi:acyl-CoA hydrolase